MNRVNNEVEIDLKDLIAELLTKWSYILLSGVFVAAVMLAFAFVKDNKLNTVIPVEDRIANAREALSTEEAESVDRIFQLYESYDKYKKSVQEYYDNYLLTGKDLSEYVEEDIVYHMSTNIYGVDSIITKLTLTPEVYEEIHDVLPDEKEAKNNSYRIIITSDTKESITVLNDDEDGVFLPNDYIFTLSIVAKTKEECNQIARIVEESINQQFFAIKAIDEDAIIAVLGSNYNENVPDWLMSRQTEAIITLKEVENSIKEINNNQINSLNTNQKNYYNVLLESFYDGGNRNVYKTSKLKYFAVGFVGGALVCCGYILLLYLLDTSIKTEGDISYRFNMPILKTVVIEGKKHLLVERVVRLLKGIDLEDKEKSLNLVATDIRILMNKKEAKKLYIVKTADSTDSQEVAESIKSILEGSGTGVSVSIGMPERESFDMSDLAESESVVILAEVRKTLFKTLDNYYERLSRYDSNVLGAVVLKKV